MKTAVFAFLLSIGFCATPANAMIIHYPDGLVLDTAKDDVTFQELPSSGKEKFLCFWTGQAQLAFVMAVHEKYNQDLQSFLAYTVQGAKKQGGTNVKMTERAVFKTADQREVRRYDITCYIAGDLKKSLHYIVKTDTGYYSVIITMIDPTAYPFVQVRADKIMAAARIGSATSQK